MTLTAADAIARVAYLSGSTHDEVEAHFRAGRSFVIDRETPEGRWI